MFNPNDFYKPTTYTVTAAARMMLVALERGGCMETELDDQRIAMFKASGLIPTRKKE